MEDVIAFERFGDSFEVCLGLSGLQEFHMDKTLAELIKISYIEK